MKTCRFKVVELAMEQFRQHTLAANLALAHFGNDLSRSECDAFIVKKMRIKSSVVGCFQPSTCPASLPSSLLASNRVYSSDPGQEDMRVLSENSAMAAWKIKIKTTVLHTAAARKLHADASETF
jgi:hypothetical protein